VHRHVTELHASQLIREVTVPQEERLSSVERYYAPTFPVVLASDRQELLPLLEGLARDVTAIFRRRQDDIASALMQTAPSSRGAHQESLLHWLCTAVICMAQEKLQEGGMVPPWSEHADGSRWLWGAEEPLDHETIRL
jgi:hypothetical protein